MRTETYRAEDIVRLLKGRKIATLAELKDVLGTNVESTVFRKLNELEYRTSYSHRGRFYTLDEIARFDALGLWSFRSVWFSQHGTLISTVAALVETSEAGYYPNELENILHVSVKVPLLKLIREERLARQEVGGRYLYVSGSARLRKQQIAARQVYEAQPSVLTFGRRVRVLPEELKAAIILFYSLLDERQRRLYAGLESMKIGHGGDEQIAALLGLNPNTVARGRRELLARDIEIERVRSKGGGRKAVEKKRQMSSKPSKRS
jgi:hypothetical protein